MLGFWRYRAAAESSLLSAYGTTYAESGLDLSERHLVYFAQHPVSELENPSQVGEGIHLLIDGENAEFNSGGGVPVYITTLFSQGIGPMSEGDFPYMGATGRTTLDDLNEDEAGTVWAVFEEARPGMTHEQIAQSYGAADEEQFITVMAPRIRALYTENLTYSKHDDWDIPATDEYGRSNCLKSGGFVLTNGNILPDYHNADGTLNWDAVNAMKQEILDGRAVIHRLLRGPERYVRQCDRRSAVCRRRVGEDEPRRVPCGMGR